MSISFADSAVDNEGKTKRDHNGTPFSQSFDTSDLMDNEFSLGGGTKKAFIVATPRTKTLAHKAKLAAALARAAAEESDASEEEAPQDEAPQDEASKDDALVTSSAVSLTKPKSRLAFSDESRKEVSFGGSGKKGYVTPAGKLLGSDKKKYDTPIFKHEGKTPNAKPKTISKKLNRKGARSGKKKKSLLDVMRAKRKSGRRVQVSVGGGEKTGCHTQKNGGMAKNDKHLLGPEDTPKELMDDGAVKCGISDNGVIRENMSWATVLE